MSIRPLILLLLPCCLNAQEVSPSARDVLEASLDSPDSAYEGQLLVETRAGDRRKEKTLTVSYAPPDRYRREVVDKYGFPVLTVVSNGEDEWIYDRRKAAAWKGHPADRDYKLLDPDEELSLLENNYEILLKAEEPVAGRQCNVLEVRARAGGRLVRKLWVDRLYGLVLQRKAYLADGSESSSMRFLHVTIPADSTDWDFDFSPPGGVKVLRNRLQPDYLELDEAATATDMEPRVPDWLPPGYLFESLNLLPYKGATILHYRYTDGVDVLSLFQAPRRARLDLTDSHTVAGRSPQKAEIGGSAARLILTSDGKFLEWWAEDHFVLVGRLGANALRRVAESLVRADKGAEAPL